MGHRFMVSFAVTVLTGSLLFAFPNNEVPVNQTLWLNCTDVVPPDPDVPGYNTLQFGKHKKEGGEATIAAQIKNGENISIQKFNGYQTREFLQSGWGKIGLQKAYVADSGTYSCSGWPISGGRGKMDIPNRLVVAPPALEPSVQAPPYVSLTKTATLMCNKAEQTEETVWLIWRRTDGGTLRGQQNESSGTLNITEVDKNDAGIYVCSYNNVAGSKDSKPVELVVHYPPEQSPCVSSSSVLRYEDDNPGIDCQISGGFPLATLRWSCPQGPELSNDTQRDNGTTVTRPLQGLVKRTMDGNTCTCQALHDSWHDDSPPRTVSVKFTVYFPPGDPKITPTTPLLENMTQTMTCKSDPGKPTNQYSWSRAGGSGNRLALTPTKDDDLKELRCMVSNNFTQERHGGPLVARFTLNVEYGPRVTLQSISVKKENQTLQMNCSADSNPPANQDSQFRWSFGPSGEDRGTGRQLELKPLTKEHSGQYRCTVTVQGSPGHGQLKGYKSTSLSIQYLHMTAVSSPTTVTQGQTLALFCTADGMPMGTFSSWSHTGEYIGRRTIGAVIDGGTIRYREESVNYTHTGIYTCRVQNGVVPGQQRDIPVTVRFPPKNKTHRPEGEKLFTELGENVTMEMTVFAYPEEVTFTWFIQSHNTSKFTRITESDEKFHIAINGSTSSLTVVNTTIYELNNYTVSVGNGVLKASEFLFMVEAKGCPKEVYIEGTKRTAVSLTTRWRPGYNSGLPQTITVKLCNTTTATCEVKETHYEPEYNKPMTTQWKGLQDKACYKIQMEAHNDYNRHKTDKNEGCTVTSETKNECTKAKPWVQNGKFTVRLDGNSAQLTWGLPTNPDSYTHQEVKQQEMIVRQRHQVGECQPPACHVVPKGQTSLTVLIEPSKQYTFTLVLYDGDVPVSSVTATEAKEPKRECLLGQSCSGAIVGSFFGGFVSGAFVLVLTVGCILRQKQLLVPLFQEKKRSKHYKQQVESLDEAYENSNHGSAMKFPTDVNQSDGAYYELQEHQGKHEYASLEGTLNIKERIGSQPNRSTEQQGTRAKMPGKHYDNIGSVHIDPDSKEYSTLSFTHNEHPYMDLSVNPKCQQI